jgi:hypothetical protein
LELDSRKKVDNAVSNAGYHVRILTVNESSALKPTYFVGFCIRNQAGESSGNAQLITCVILYLVQNAGVNISPAPTKMRG